MNQVDFDAYLGDLISKHGTNDKNLDARKAKAFGIKAEIMSILKEVPFGKYRIDAGLKLRMQCL